VIAHGQKGNGKNYTFYFFQICLFAMIACAFAAPQYLYGAYPYAHHLPADTLPATVQAGLVHHPNGAVTPAQTPAVAAAAHAHLATKFGYGPYFG